MRTRYLYRVIANIKLVVCTCNVTPKNGHERGGTIVLFSLPHEFRLCNNLKRGYVTDAYGLGITPFFHHVTAYINGHLHND
jgi:hypothetical protein